MKPNAVLSTLPVNSTIDENIVEQTIVFETEDEEEVNILSTVDEIEEVDNSDDKSKNETVFPEDSVFELINSTVIVVNSESVSTSPSKTISPEKSKLTTKTSRASMPTVVSISSSTNGPLAKFYPNANTSSSTTESMMTPSSKVQNSTSKSQNKYVENTCSEEQTESTHVTQTCTNVETIFKTNSVH